MKEKGREIFLRQLQDMDGDSKVVDWVDNEEQERRYQKLANEFQIPEDLRNAFTAYIREYAENIGQCTRTDGVFFNDENVDAGIYDKLYYFYRPLADELEKDFPSLRIRVYIEPSCDDKSAVLFVAESVNRRYFALPFVVFEDHFKAWNAFFDRFEPEVVYKFIGRMYEEAAKKVQLGMSLVPFED